MRRPHRSVALRVPISISTPRRIQSLSSHLDGIVLFGRPRLDARLPRAPAVRVGEAVRPVQDSEAAEDVLVVQPAHEDDGVSLSMLGLVLREEDVCVAQMTPPKCVGGHNARLAAYALANDLLRNTSRTVCLPHNKPASCLRLYAALPRGSLCLDALTPSWPATPRHGILPPGADTRGDEVTTRPISTAELLSPPPTASRMPCG